MNFDEQVASSSTVTAPPRHADSACDASQASALIPGAVLHLELGGAGASQRLWRCCDWLHFTRKRPCLFTKGREELRSAFAL